MDEIPATLQFVEDDSVEMLEVIIFTDGSKISKKSVEVGFGWIMRLGDVILAEGYDKLLQAIMFQAEVYAISVALDWLVLEMKHKGDCTIFMDSQASLGAIKSKLVSSRLVLATREKLARA